ncbi:2-methylisocitrate lyase-like PEP mutase family enzyme [Amycolatopsis echigonensis]|uniref:2-methylisocitrate lyase-like PEP mutase family enzyme n=1 Tax=Amycolatopsis echigonensis TaxID=2576905 RepID=A0A2N3X1K9_9PSEU|nr:isocitrate lyase/PEP mutase family protein [Amycolatopsis niigatensis]PKW00006.1 2-methylisocitrate lyase-like PEP mutase family enzyme [Amycolatopsis niigatensis]
MSETAGVRARLRELLEERSAVVAPGVFDGLSAALTASAGFRAAYLSGAAVAAAAGLPDVGLATQTEFVHQLALVTGLLDVPVVADADTGFGDVTHTYRTVRLYERAGAAAIQLEDQEFPKRCGHLDGKQVVPAEEFARTIEVAAEARQDPDTVLIGRTDACAALGFDEAVRRANLYAEAGADLVFLEAPRTLDEVRQVPARVKAPALFNLVPRGKTPAVELAELAELGYALVIMPGLCVGSAASAMRSALERAARGDVGTDGQDSPRGMFDALGLPFWEDLRERYAKEPADA